MLSSLFKNNIKSLFLERVMGYKSQAMKQVSLFIPCLVDFLLPEIAEATLLLLRKLNLDPIYHQKQTCCGQPAVNAGYIKQARQAAMHFIDIFENDDMIVCPSGSCVVTVKYRYPELFQDNKEWLKKARQVGTKIFELSQFLVDVLKIEDVGASFRGQVAYHQSCQNYRSLGINDQPIKILQAVKEAELVPLNQADACCGFGGEFSVNFPAISEAMVKEKTDNFINSGADVLVLSEPGCLLNVNGYLNRHYPEKKAMHISSFLMSGQREKLV